MSPGLFGGMAQDELRKFHTLPFLSIESDGNPFPQIVETRIEAFALQVERLHNASKISMDTSTFPV